MLSIGKLAGGGEDYYLEAVAAGLDDYYLGAGEAPGVWLGGAADLGLTGKVAPEDLRAVLAGRDPSGDQLALAPPGRSRVPATTSPSAPPSPSRSFTPSARRRCSPRCWRPTSRPWPRQLRPGKWCSSDPSGLR